MNLWELSRGDSPLVIDVPHAGTHVPDAIAARLTDAARPVPDTDWHVEKLYAFARDAGATLMVATHSRIAADLNRDPSGAALYAGAKAFVSTFTRGIARELVRDNIRVNAVSPGVIETPFHERYSTPQMLETMRATIPMNRLGTADECAGAFLYLASEALSGYVTGQIIEVNGGQLMP